LENADMAVIDAEETTEGALYTYKVLSSGSMAWLMVRYCYLDSLIVLDDPSIPRAPSILIDEVRPDKRYVRFTTATAGAEIWYQLGHEATVENVRTVTNISLSNDTTGGVPAVYDTLTYYDRYTVDTILWTNYELYDQNYNIEVDATAPYVRAYSSYLGKESLEITRKIDTEGTIDLNTPVITYVGSTAAGKQFVITVDNGDKLDSQPIYYTLPGGELTAYTDTLVVPNGVYGWMTAFAQMTSCTTSSTAYRYIDGRDAYNETYEAVVAETEALPTAAADLEFANVAELSAEQTAALTPTGNIYFHKQVHANYNSLVLPFNLTTANLESGAVKVTDASGKSLVRGTDYELARIQKSTDYTNIAADLAAGKLTHTANIVNSHTYLLKVADNLVGQDLIFVSAAGTTISVSKPSFSAYAADGSWNVVNNSTFAPIVTEVPVYYVNDAGDALVRQDAGFVIAPFTSAVIADEATTAATAFIPLISGATAIESIGADLEQQGVVFDMMGRRVQDMKAGHIYIIGGKKVMR
jgi:hypothetical protein